MKNVPKSLRLMLGHVESYVEGKKEIVVAVTGWQIADNFGGGEIHLNYYATSAKKVNQQNYFNWCQLHSKNLPSP